MTDDKLKMLISLNQKGMQLGSGVLSLATTQTMWLSAHRRGLTRSVNYAKLGKPIGFFMDGGRALRNVRVGH